MSLYGTMRTAVSGMNAQSTRLGTVADNIANSGTNGYKRASVEFSSLVIPNAGTGYVSGGVATAVRYSIASEGVLSYTTSITDLALRGNGFFVVSDSNGSPNLTRAGSFVPDANGYLVNAAGFRLMGYDYGNGIPSPVANGYAGLVPVKLEQATLTAVPSTHARLSVNVPYGADEQGTAIAGMLPSQNSSWSSASSMSTIIGTSPSGTTVYSYIFFTKIEDNTWEITVFDSYGAHAGGFPYDLTTGNIKMATSIVTFDPVMGSVVGGNPLLVSDPSDPIEYDFSAMLQEASWFSTTTSVGIKQNLPSDTAVLGGGELLPSSNDPASTFHKKMKVSAIGNGSFLDVYFTRTGPDTWEVTAYDCDAGVPVLLDDFPYGAPPGTATLTFDMGTGSLISGGSLTVPLFVGGTVDLDLSGLVSVPAGTPGDHSGFAMSFNLPSMMPIITPSMYPGSPAANQPSSPYSEKTSFLAYDHVGNEVLLDVYLTKGPDNHWEITVFNQADASPSGSFPYGSPGSAPLATALVEFDPTTGKLIDGGMLTVPIPNGEALTLDMTGMTQLAAGFTLIEIDVNGSGPANVSGYSISDDGILYLEYEKGGRVAQYKLALANVQSPDQMIVLPGNVFQPSTDSGDVQIGFATEGGLGKIISGALENSNVDIAEELTNMIEAQRNYTANSKVFQTGSDLMDVLVNLKR